MEENMKRFLSLFLCFLCLPLLAAPVLAEEHHWFFKPVADARPQMPPEGVGDVGDAILIGRDEKRVYLTFDAGYVNENVVEITRILKQEGVPAAFFVLKHTVEAYPELVREWHEAGFLVGNHTMTHPNLARVDAARIEQELVGLEEPYLQTVGVPMDKYFRPPEGSYNQQVLSVAKSLGYRTVFWSAAYADWDNDAQMPKREALSLLLSRTHAGAVVLLHPTSATNAALLADYISALRAAGYTFGALSEL